VAARSSARKTSAPGSGRPASSRTSGVDHGVCLHRETKLRTVLWGWAGEDLTAEETALLRELCGRLDGALGAELSRLVAPAEVAALRRRVERLLDAGHLPYPSEGWPAIPWPPF
jgi:uncharacterized repeat protein (TIGR03843 family)